jgi:hypothetical protein
MPTLTIKTTRKFEDLLTMTNYLRNNFNLFELKNKDIEKLIRDHNLTVEQKHKFLTTTFEVE